MLVSAAGRTRRFPRGRANARCRRRAEARRRRRSFSSSAGPDGTPLMVLSTRPAPETPSPL